ncbi:hypothetical protein BDY19DRAFT_989202 [Irpex rosettiformis]|uniref:Uncharacterized protein n=1 Tax=Irpex rosettiformis TaxID=378272 RepID=A0ACB8UH01_9APHY|nr:hypothetical protein BDY19DRAFT_989202 [Irpex rosettiformis]
MEDTQAAVESFVDHTGRDSPESSDSDAVNTSTARVYFGPLKSAERERAQRVNPGQPTPVKRSTRLSSIAALQMQDGGRNAVESVVSGQESNQSSRSDTPIIAEDLLEEPSVLATKVLSACGNPSPPPSPPLEPAPTSTSIPELDSDIFAPINNVSEVVDKATVKDVLPQSLDEEPPQLAGGTQPPMTEFVSEPVEEDLIIFDSFSSPSAVPRMRVMPATPLPSHSTVDDLLSLSPIPPLTTTETIPSGEDVLAQIIPVPPRESTPSVVDEAEVAFTLSHDFDAVPPIPSMPPTGAIGHVELNKDVPLVVLTPTAEQEPQTPPLRRSTRPKRSVSPFLLPLTSTPAKIAAHFDSSAPTTPNASSTRKRKAKARASGLTKPLDLGVPANDRIETPLASRPPSSTIDVLLEELNKDFLAQAKAQDDHVNGTLEPPLEGSAAPVASTRKPVAHRLGSLSPTSHDVLMQLLPSSDEPSNTPGDTPTPLPDVSAVSLSTQAEGQTSIIPGISIPPTLPSTPQRPSASSKTADFTRTPARRVAINEAIAQGSLSPEKARNLLATVRPAVSALNAAGPSFPPPAANGLPRSPARRVLISEGTTQTLRSPQKGKTPVRPSLLGRSRSASIDVIPTPALFPKVQRSASVEPPKPRIPTFRKPASADGTTKLSEVPNPLPFPIVPRLPSTIVEVDEQPTAIPSPPIPASKPPSTLRQPSTKAESKIPRPGSKPYARPIRPGTVSNVSRLPPPSTTKKVEPAVPPSVPAVQPQPMRLVRKVSVKPVIVDSSSDTDTVQPVAGPGPRTLAHRSATVPPAVSNPTVAILKRKRETPESRASPPGAKPFVLLRRVVRPPSATKPQSVKSPSPTGKGSPSRARTAPSGTAQARIRMRKVVDTRKAKEVPPPEEPSHPPEHETKETRIPRPSFLSAGSPRRQSAIVEIMSSPIIGDDEVIGPAPQDDLTTTEVAETPPNAASDPMPAPEESEPETNGLRRTSRRRKSAQSTDVFGPVAPTSTRQAQSRLKSVLPPDNSVFFGMSALALKTLTTTNTTRNQKQFSELQTEVIMKEGKRPDSPTTKVRTTLDKQKEEKVLEREERAARRARKAAATGEENGAEEDPDISLMSLNEDPVDNTKHARGPGEEGDYETPERPERPLKRGRFEDGGSGDVAGWSNGEDKQLDKRVKWDHGLSKTFFLTGTPPNPKRPPKEELTKKGCLAIKSKTVRLDTMGNVLNADIPVPDIIPESIVVQKFVYEDDPEAQPEPSSPAKATRSKTKRKT